MVAVVALAMVTAAVAVTSLAGSAGRATGAAGATGEVRIPPAGTQAGVQRPGASGDASDGARGRRRTGSPAAQVAAPRRCVRPVGPPVDCVRWSVELGGVQWRDVASHGGTVYAVVRDRLAAFRLADGGLRWATAVGPGWRLATADDAAVALRSEATGDVIVLDPGTGRTRWMTRRAGAPLDVASVGPWLYVSDGSTIWCHGASTGALAWSRQAPEGAEPVLTPFGAFLVHDDRLARLGGNTGRPLWVAATDGRTAVLRADDQLVVAVSDTGVVHGVGAESGRVRWRSPALGPPRSVDAPVERTALAVATRGRITSLAAGDGAVRWSIEDPATPWPVAVAGRAAVYTNRIGRTVSLGGDDGDVRWFSGARSGHTILGEVGDAVLVSARDLSALDVASGAEVWRLQLDAPARLVHADTPVVVTPDAILALAPPGAG